MDFDDTNRGVLFQETEKKSEKAPDYTGKLNVEGKEYRLAGWKRQSKNGKPFLSLSISEPQQSNYNKARQVADELRPEEAAERAENIRDGYKEDGIVDLSEIPF